MTKPIRWALGLLSGKHSQYIKGWNDCHKAMTEKNRILRSLVDEAFHVLDDWSGDRIMVEVEKEKFCDLWQKLGDFRGWDRNHPESTVDNRSI